LKLYFIVGGEKVKEVNITLSIRERERERELKTVPELSINYPF
jgi:hypothetical protein